MNCEQMRAMLDAYIDGELSAEEMRALRDHAAACEDCKRELEAAELLEVFQWSGADLTCRDKLPRIREELADVLSYCILMADVCGLDLDEIMNEKVTKNEAKYPVEKARGNAAKYTEL